MATLQATCDAEGAVRWKLVQQPKAGGQVPVHEWTEGAPVPGDVTQLAEDFGPEKYRLYSYRKGSRPGVSHVFHIKDEPGAAPVGPEVSATRALVAMADHVKKMHEQSVKSWEGLAREQLKTVAALTKEVQELKVEVAEAKSPWGEVGDAAVELASENPKLLELAIAGLTAAVAKLTAGKKGAEPIDVTPPSS